MKRTLILLTLPALLLSCQANSYYQAMSVNEERFGGEQLDDAEMLTETYDMALLLEDMATLAMNKAEYRKTYLLASDVKEKIQTLKQNYKVEAALQRIKLSSALKPSSDEQLNRLEKVSDENFDTMYAAYSHSKLNELTAALEHYLKSGSNTRILSLAQKEKTDLEALTAEMKEAPGTDLANNL